MGSDSLTSHKKALNTALFYFLFSGIPIYDLRFTIYDFTGCFWIFSTFTSGTLL